MFSFSSCSSARRSIATLTRTSAPRFPKIFENCLPSVVPLNTTAFIPYDTPLALPFCFRYFSLFCCLYIQSNISTCLFSSSRSVMISLCCLSLPMLRTMPQTVSSDLPFWSKIRTARAVNNRAGLSRTGCRLPRRNRPWRRRQGNFQLFPMGESVGKGNYAKIMRKRCA